MKLKKLQLSILKKKPIIFQKKVDKAVTKSTILSNRDLKIAKATFKAVKKKKMANCNKTFQKKLIIKCYLKW